MCHVLTFVHIKILADFLYYCGWVFLVTTTLVGVLKSESKQRVDEEPSLDIISTYRQLLRIIRLPAVRELALILLTTKVSPTSSSRSVVSRPC